MLQQRQRSRSNRQQSWMLALGCGSSMVLHLGLIAGISYWWRSPAPVDEPIEITLVAPSEIEPVAVASPPPLTKPPKIKIAPIPAQVAQPQPTVLKSVSKPIVVTPAPKSVAVVVKPISKPIRATAQPKPRSSSIPTKVKPNPSPIQTAKVNRPVTTKPIVKPFPIAPKTPTPKPVQTPLIDNPIATTLTSKSVQSQPKIKTTPNPPFTFPTPQLPQTPAIKIPLDRSISKNSRSQPISPPIPVKPNSQAAAIPKSPPATSPDDPITPATTSDLSSPIGPKSQTRSATIAQPPVGGNIPNNDDKPIFNRDLLPGGGLTRNGGQLNSPPAGNPQAPDSSPPSGNGDRDALSEGLLRRQTLRERQRVGSAAPGVDSSSSTSQTAGGGGLQCIERCQIPKLRDLQDRDGGKDRLRIRIVIDPKGSVLEATISKSSDNPQIDAIVLAGIKQMQFKPPGKIIKGIIKANILL
jgi:TonB family protein